MALSTDVANGLNHGSNAFPKNSEKKEEIFTTEALKILGIDPVNSDHFDQTQNGGFSNTMRLARVRTLKFLLSLRHNCFGLGHHEGTWRYIMQAASTILATVAYAFYRGINPLGLLEAVSCTTSFDDRDGIIRTSSISQNGQNRTGEFKKLIVYTTSFFIRGQREQISDKLNFFGQQLFNMTKVCFGFTPNIDDSREMTSSLRLINALYKAIIKKITEQIKQSTPVIVEQDRFYYEGNMSVIQNRTALSPNCSGEAYLSTGNGHYATVLLGSKLDDEKYQANEGETAYELLSALLEDPTVSVSDKHYIWTDNKQKWLQLIELIYIPMAVFVLHFALIKMITSLKRSTITDRNTSVLKNQTQQIRMRLKEDLTTIVSAAVVQCSKIHKMVDFFKGKILEIKKDKGLNRMEEMITYLCRNGCPSGFQVNTPKGAAAALVESLGPSLQKKAQEELAENYQVFEIKIDINGRKIFGCILFDSNKWNDSMGMVRKDAIKKLLQKQDNTIPARFVKKPNHNKEEGIQFHNTNKQVRIGVKVYDTDDRTDADWFFINSYQHKQICDMDCWTIQPTTNATSNEHYSEWETV